MELTLALKDTLFEVQRRSYFVPLPIPVRSSDIGGSSYSMTELVGPRGLRAIVLILHSAQVYCRVGRAVPCTAVVYRVVVALCRVCRWRN